MLRYRADIRTLLFVAAYFVVAALPWIYWDVLSTAQIVVLVVLNCLLSFICAVTVHNTVHLPIFRYKWMNRVYQIILSFTYGHPVSAYVPGHNLSHHRYTQTAKDNIRTDKARFRINFFNQLLFMPIMSGDILKSEMRFARKMYKEKPSWFRQYALEFVLVFGVKIGLLIYNWQCGLLFMILPHYYAAWGIVSTNFFQHDGCDENHPYNHSRNFTGTFFNWFLFNNGYHGAHHMKPSLHWSLLPAYHREHLRPHLHPSLDRVSLLAYLWEAHIYPGRRVDYLGNPVKLKAVEPDQDWVADVKVGDYREDMAVEG